MHKHVLSKVEQSIAENSPPLIPHHGDGFTSWLIKFSFDTEKEVTTLSCRCYRDGSFGGWEEVSIFLARDDRPSQEKW